MVQVSTLPLAQSHCLIILRMIMYIVTYFVSLHLSSEGTTKLKEDHPHSKHINLLCLILLYRESSPLLWACVKGGTSNIAARLSFWPGRIHGYREQQHAVNDISLFIHMYIVLHGASAATFPVTRPKSPTFKVSSSQEMKILEGFRSRWMNPFLWM